jgi:hypothetical protein
LERIRNFYPQELENLSDASLAELWPLFEKQFGETGKKDAKKKWERTKRRSHGGWLDSIEYQFGGAGEAAWQKSPFSALLGQPYKPTCLGKILNGTPINMRELQDLFWPLRRDRFPKDLPRDRKVREIVYPLRALLITMEAFLNEKPKERKRARGKARRIWLRDPKDPGLRIRVLRRMEAHIKSIASEEIADPFLAVIDRYLPDSAE